MGNGGVSCERNGGCMRLGPRDAQQGEAMVMM
jgi:hypothetical protein